MNHKYLFRIILIFAFALMGCEKQTHTVRYEIDGTVPEISVAYKNGTNGNESADLAPGWSTEFTVESYYRVNLRVSTKNSDGSVTCRIYIDGELAAEATASGKFKHASCSEFPVPPQPEESS
ncbi:MAG: hypothetical protein AAGD96_01520 [Chloroflexota bacterium]